MMVEHSERIDAVLRRYKDEVMRWNAGFSLVSRVATLDRLDNLVAESVSSYEALMESVLPAAESSFPGPAAAYHYADLGSGAGIPGLVWHLLSGELGFGGREHVGSILVEPRHKRAWFLERAIEVMGLRDIRVGEDQWGPRTALCGDDLPASMTGVVTMKALRLTDEEVIAGWRRYRRDVRAADDSLVICRLHGRSRGLDDDLRGRLRLPAAGSGGCPGTPRACLFPVGGDSRPWSLLVSLYPHL